MKTFGVLAMTALLGAGALAPSAVQARGGGSGGAVAAGLIGGLAAGALLGTVVSEAHAGPYDAGPYDDGPDYDDRPAPLPAYRPARLWRPYAVAPVYERRRFDPYAGTPIGYGERPAPRPRHRDCERRDGYGPDGDGW